MDKQLTINEAMIKVAKSYVGIKEIPPNKGWKDKEFQAKMKAMGWRAGQSWCMYFVKLVMVEAYGMIGNASMVEWCHKLDGSVMNSYKKLKAIMTTVNPLEPAPGLIGIMQRNGGDQGHVFIVDTAKLAGDQKIMTLEGNSGDAVTRVTRFTDYMLKNDLKLISYIQLR